MASPEELITREQFLNQEATFDEYYQQFVDDSVKSLVLSCWNKSTLQAAKAEDEYLNSLPLEHWDKLAEVLPMHVQRKIVKANGTGGISLSDKVCCLKRAADMIVADASIA